MLKKLLKYEYMATGRVLLPIYGVMIILSLISAVLGMDYSEIGFKSYFDGSIYNVLITGIISMLLVFMFIISGIVTFVMLLQRFYKNLLRDEGYLMNTLPVKSWQIVLSKLISSISWITVAMFVAVICGFCTIQSLASEIADNSLFELFRAVLTVRGLIWLIYVISAFAKFVMQCYLSMTVGQIANTHKIWTSIGVYIGINVLLSFVSNMVMHFYTMSGTESIYDYAFNEGEYVILFCMTASMVLISAIFFAITNHLLKNRLNLE